jgi:phage repressor protein C with HTH and peptisase S24 domain
MDIGKRLHELRLGNKITAQELAERISVSQSYISLLENNKRRANVEILGKIAAVFNVSMAQLFSESAPAGTPPGEHRAERAGVDLDKMYQSGQLHAMADIRGNVSPVQMRLIPVVSKVAAGDPAAFSDGEYPVGFAEEFVPAPADIDDLNAFALRVAGDSMSPRFRDGDIVICSPARVPDNGDAVVAKVRNDETTCKVYYLDGKNVILSPVNPRYPAQVYPLEEIKWIYPVVICQRREKR